MKIRILIVGAIIFVSCKKEEKSQNEKVETLKVDTIQKSEGKLANNSDIIVVSKKHEVNKILGD